MPLNYEIGWWTRMVAGFPRIDFTFTQNNATININDNQYLENICTYGLIPILWLLFTLFMFLIYFCYRCCQRDIEKKRKVPCARTTLVIFSVLICLVAGVGFFSNQLMYNNINTIKQSISVYHNYYEDISTSLIDKTKVEESHINNADQLNLFISKEDQISNDEKVTMTKRIKDYLKNVNIVQDYLQQISNKYAIYRYNMKDRIAMFDLIEYVRWISTMCFMVGVIVLSILLIIGVIVSSKCTLLLYCSLSILIMVLFYMISSIQITLIMVSSDICMAPSNIVHSSHSDGLEYYLLCNSTFSPETSMILNNLTQKMKSENKKMEDIKTTFMRSSAYENVAPSRKKAYDTLTTQSIVISSEEWNKNLTAKIMDCELISNEYKKIVISKCNGFLPGLDVLTCVFLTLGLLFTITTIIASRAWRNFGTNKRMFSHHASVPEENDYLVCNDDYPNQQYSFSRGRQGNPREHMSMQRRNTPPPAYKALTQGSMESAPDTVPPTPEHHRRYAAMGYGRETDA